MLIADEPDMPGNSGPTVVDDAKVAEVLKKLRSLDAPPGPLTGVTEIVLDSGSSEPTRIGPQSIQIDSGPVIDVDPGPGDEGVRASQRTTAVGRSLATPVAGQPITIPAELARGTLFGRGIHLPDVNAPEEASIELSSGAVDFADGAVSEPFALAEKLVIPPPTSAPAPVYDPGTGSYDSGPHTQLVPPRRSRAVTKMVAFLLGVGVIGAAFWALQIRGKETATPAAPAPAGATAPAATAPAATAPAAPAPAGPAAEAPAPAPASPHPAAAPEPAPSKPAAAAVQAVQEEPTPEAGTPRSKTRRSWATRPAAAKPATAAKPAKAAPPAAEAADDAEPPPATKPGHGKKRGVDEDPDATMAPSM